MQITGSASSPLWVLTRVRTPRAPQPASLYALVGDDGEIFGAFRLTTLPNGNEKGFEKGTRVRARDPKGRLRLIRTGSQLQYVVADGESPYHQIRTEEIGRDDIESLKCFAFSGWGPVAVDVRFTDLVIDTDSLPDAATEAPGSSAWWITAVVILCLVLVPLPLAGWLFLRQRRFTSKTPGNTAAEKLRAGGESTLPPVSFPCSACGKRLKAKAKLAGKKVKCTTCGQAVLVPCGSASIMRTEQRAQ